MHTIGQRGLSLLVISILSFSGERAAFAENILSRVKEAAAISVVAHSKSSSKDYNMCAELYHQAFVLDPNNLGYLYSAARCEQKGELLDRAEKHYRVFLQRSSEDSSLAQRARNHLQEIIEFRKVSPPAPVEAPQLKSQPSSPLPKATGVDPNTLRRWSLISGALLVASGGGYFLTQGHKNEELLNDKLSNTSQGYIVGITPKQAQRDERGYRTQYTLGGLLIGAGLGAFAAGTWYFKAAPEGIKLAISDGGASVQGTFSW